MATVLLFVFGFEKIKMFLDEFSIKTKDFESLTSAINAFSSSRIEIWSVYLKDWISNPIFIIFGRGISSPILIEVKVLNSIRKLSPHNMFLTMFYQLGVIGAILYITLIVFVIKDAFKGQSKASKAILIPLISFLMLAMVEDLFFYMF